MCSSIYSLTILVLTTITKGLLYKNFSVENINFYKNLLLEVEKQESYDGLLIVSQARTQDPRLQAIYALGVPKTILSEQLDVYYEYKSKFDSDLVAVVIMNYEFQSDLWEILVSTINHMRQIRILMILVNTPDSETLQKNILFNCEQSKITNIIIHFLNSSDLQGPTPEYLLLSPYPEYHLQVQKFHGVKEYYRSNILNMEGKMIITLPDQNIPRSIMYIDENDELHLEGFAFKIIQLFTKIHNATYKFLYRPKPHEAIHITTLMNMTERGLLDIPMTFHPIYDNQTVQHVSYPVEYSKWVVMFPCARQISVNDLYEELLSVHLFISFLLFAIAFSFAYSVTEKVFNKRFDWLNLLMSDKVIPGLLSQSYNIQRANLLVLRCIYIFIFIIGMYMTTSISARLNTFLTRPPLYKEIKSFEDLRRRGITILFDKLDIPYLATEDLTEMKGLIEYFENTTEVYVCRQNFNTTYAYAAGFDLWNIFASIQLYYSHKLFCLHENLFIRDTVLMGIPLASNSPYKKYMDELVHNIHVSGIFQMWEIHVVNNLLQLDNISLRETGTLNTYKALTETDLLHVWKILLIGLIFSLLVFFVEIVVCWCGKNCWKQLKL